PCSDPPGARSADDTLVQLQDDPAHGGQVSAVEQLALRPLDIDDEQRRPSELDNLTKRLYGNLDRTDFAARAEHRRRPQVLAAEQRYLAGGRANGAHLQGWLDLIERIGLSDARLEIGIGLVGKHAARPESPGTIGGDTPKPGPDLEHDVTG